MSDITHEQLMEKAARVMCRSLGDDWEREGGESLTAYVDAARDVIATIAETTRDPTARMVDAGLAASERQSVWRIIRAAHLASPIYPEEK